MTDEPLPPPPPPSAPPPPPPEPPSSGPVPSPIPWEDRDRLGFGTALIENVKLFVTAPQEGFRRMMEKGDYASPIIFGIILGWVGTAIGYFWNLLFGSSLMMLPGMSDEMGTAMMLQGAASIGGLIIAPIFIIIGLFLGAGILHLCLMLLKGTEGSQAGFEGTLRVVSYASVAQLAQVIPFVGGLVALVWLIVLYVMGLSSVHRTTQGKAVLAVVLPLVLCCVCIAIAVAIGVGGLMAGSGAIDPSIFEAK